MTSPPQRPPLSSPPKPPAAPPIDLAPLTDAVAGVESYLRQLVDSFPFTLNSTSQVLENTRPVKSGLGYLFGISGFNSNTASQFVLVFDHDEPPQNGAVPVAIFDVAGSSTFTVLYAPFGRTCYQGIVVCNSSTPDTLTLGAADCFFDVQYL